MTQQDGIEMNMTGEHFDEEAVSETCSGRQMKAVLWSWIGPAFDTKLLCGVKQAISCRYQSDTESQVGMEGTFKVQLVPAPCHGQKRVCLL